MISVDLLYQKVNELLAKNQSGYGSGDEFNNDLQLAQNDLLLYYKPTEDQSVHNAIRPFLSEDTNTIAATIALPADYFYHLNGRVSFFVQDGGQAKVEERSADFMDTDEDYMTLDSPIRGPSFANRVFLYRIRGGSIVPKPVFTGNFTLSYIRRPLTPVWGFTVDLVNEIEVYDAGATTDLEWPEEQLSNFVAVLAFYRGVQVKDNEIVQYLASRGVRNPEGLQEKTG